ncbi:hypothetical protein M1O53_01005 [Dehalococcoidia bacterium]|nr:hypothetical protein [Dehalococcoidia bacterium]
MRKVIMGVGVFLAVVGLIQLILSVALIGPVRARVPEIDRTIDDAAGALTKVADATDRGVDFLAELDPELAKLEKTIGDTIDESVGRLGDLDANLAEVEVEVPGGIDGVVRFLDDLDGVLAEVERPLELMDDTVRVLDDLENSMALVEGRVAATLEAAIDYLSRLDAAMVEADGVATLTIDDTLEYLRELGATLALVDETVTGIRDSVIFTRDSAVEEMERWEVVVCADRLHLEPWAEALEVWAEELEAFGVDPAFLLDVASGIRDWAADIGPGWYLFPRMVDADTLDFIALRLEGAGLDAEWLRAEADRWRQEGLGFNLTPEGIAEGFAPAIESLEHALDSLADTSGYLGTLQTSLADFRKLAVDNIAAAQEFLGDARTSIEAVDQDILDSIAYSRELLGRARTSIAAAKGPIADGLAGSRAALQATESSVEAARSPVVDGIASTRKLLETAKTSLEDIKTPALGGISDTRGYLQTAQADIGALGEDLRVISGDIVGLGIGGMILGMIGWLQTFMILMSILFMAAGAGLFLLGMKKEES